MSPARLVAVLLAQLLVCVLAPLSSAQIPNAGDTTSTPAPGQHDYLGTPQETVNPANGSVSIRIPVRMVQGRQFTLPFSFAYDSNGAFYVAPGPEGGAPMYVTPSEFTGSTSLGGWSFSYPTMSLTGGSWTIPGSLDNLITCYGSTNYTFQDPNGGRHNLGLSVSANVASPDGIDNCNEGLAGDGEYTSGQEGPFAASTSIPDSNNGAWPETYVTDGDGTSYYFRQISSSSGVATEFATSVTDRNGNTVTISTSQSGAVTYTDTLGRQALSASGMGGNPDTVSLAGLSVPYKVNWGSVSPSFPVNMLNQCTGAGCVGCPTQLASSSKIASSIALPNGQQFTLSYDQKYGMLNEIKYPNGGYVRYVWGLNLQAEDGAWSENANGTLDQWICRYDFPAITDRYVSYDGTTEVLHQNFQYNTNWPNNSSLTWNYKTTTVTTTDLSRNTSFVTIYKYLSVPTPLVPNCAGCYNTQQIPVEQCIEHYDYTGSGGVPPSSCPNLNPPGKLLRTEIKSWPNPRTLLSLQTVLDNGQSSLTTYCYDANEQIKEKDEYDLGNAAPTLSSCATVPSGTVSGPALRKTATTYAAFTGHIVDKPSTDVTYDGSGNRIAETDFPSYDGNGNLLTETAQCLTGGQTCSEGNSTTTYTYDSNGQTISMTDPCGTASCSDMTGSSHTTSYSYTDNYASCGGSAPPTSPSDAYLTQLTDPAGHTKRFCYDYSRGLLLSSTDENNQTTTYAYADSLDRLTQTSYPDGGSTTFSYNDSPYNSSTPSPSVTTTSAMTSSTNFVSLSAFDGLGHTVRNALTSDPDCASADRKDTTYDGLGRVLTVSNPYCTTSDPTYGITTYTYDALGRALQVTNPDNSTVLTSYAGRAMQVQDEGNGTQPVARISQSDALGRLTSVCEVASPPFVGASGASASSLIGQNGSPAACGQDIAGNGFITNYGYDVLGNLTSVSQGGMTRSFTYDSLSRLTGSVNPESNTATTPSVTTVRTIYTYDSNGNLSTKIAPAPNQSSDPGPVNPVGTTQASTNNGSSAQWSVNVSPVAGDALLVGCDFSDVSFVGVSDSAGDTFTLVAPESDSSDASARAYLATNVKGGATTVTCTAAAAPPNNEIYVTELQGVNSANPVDQVLSVSGPSSPASGSLTTTNANEFLWAYATAGAVTNASGWTALSTFDSNLVASLLQVTPATVQASFNTNSDWTFILVAFNPASGSGSSATVTTSYQYDALNRLTQKSYSDGTTPTASYAYDGIPGQNYVNAIGRLVASSVPSSVGYIATLTNSYDAMGRVTQQHQYNPAGGSNSYPLSYSYNLMGDMTSFVPGWSWSSTYNTAARVTTFTSTLTGTTDPPCDCPATLLSGAHYNAAGQITTDTLGTGEAETFSYDKRLRLQAESSSLNSTSIYSFSLTFAPNGDVTAANDSVNGNWNYSYDQFNRLVCANVASNGACATPPSGTPTYTYVYDRFGNRWQQNGQYSMQLTFTGNSPGNPANNNRMDGYSYDAAGNLLYDGSHHYFYDAENRLIQVDGTLPYCTSNGASGSAATACYYYDAQGQRVYRTGFNSGDGCTVGRAGYTFDLQGRWVGLYSSPNGTGCKGETYLGGRHLVTYADGEAYFDHTDWLGTSRVRNGASYPFYNQHCTSLPFGDGLTCNSTGQYMLHFTGKERDFESGLDNFGARYDSSNFGRFMSADPDNAGSSVEVPQSWNAYSYVLNNPLILVDPDGLDCIYVNNDTGEQIGFNRGDCDNSTEEKANSGYYVDGKVDTSSITFTKGEAKTLLYSFTPDNGLGFSQIGHQCVGNCPYADSTVTVNADAPSDAPPMIPYVHPLVFTYNPPTTFLGRLNLAAGCYGGLEPDLAGNMDDLNTPRPELHEGEKTEEGQAKDRAYTEGKEVKESKPLKPGPAGRFNRRSGGNAAAEEKYGGPVAWATNASECSARGLSH